MQQYMNSMDAIQSPTVAIFAVVAAEAAVPVAKKRIGRPPKTVVVKEVGASAASAVSAPVRRRGGGRPITSDDPVNKLRREKWRARKERLMKEGAGEGEGVGTTEKQTRKPRQKANDPDFVPKKNARVVLGVLKPSTTKEYPKEAYMPSREACIRLGVHNCTLHSWQKKGLIEAYRDNQRMWLYNVDRFLEETDMVLVPIDAVIPLIEKRPYNHKSRSGSSSSSSSAST
jgi:hypothetical protein